MSNVKVSNIELQVTSDSSRATKAYDKSIDSLRRMKKESGAAANSLKRLKDSFKQLKEGADSATKPIKTLVDSIKRIAFYRMIRSAIKAVTTSIKEGINNLYQYSAALNSLDAASAKNTMDAFATAALYVKNSLGAALMPVLQSLVPLIDSVAEAFATAANAVNQFFHALKGEAMFTKAKKYAVDYADALGGASGKAKELKKQIFGFDELNIFNEPSSGGRGGASGLDYSQMFEESSVADWIQKLAQNQAWESLGSILAMKLNAAIAQFDAREFGSNLGKKIQSGIGTAFGFLENFNFKSVGEKLSTILNNIIYEIKWEEVGHIFATKFTAVLDFLGGFLSELDTGALASAIGSVIIGALDHFVEWLDAIDWYTFGQTFFTKVYDFVTNIDFQHIAQSFFTLFASALSAAWEFAKGLVSQLYIKVSEYFHKKTEECGGNAILGFLKGIVDALFGIVAWVNTNIVTPFIDAIKTAFGIEGVDCTSMTEIGQQVIDGFFNGLTTAWVKVAEWITRVANGVKSVFSSIVEGIRNFKPESPRALDWGITSNYYAEGGTPQKGELFWAGERGPELLTQVGGQTTVTTQDQFTSGMEDIMDNTNTVILQAAQALIGAIQSINMNPVVQIGDRQVVQAYDRGKKLAGASLVE